ncbi:MAG: inositol monophosphatase family protein [Candidatus Aenigmarchaeota archaeon]|nr:inositol monophosphatase family protein [Candidatus Aenigmarchaeota archaeon]
MMRQTAIKAAKEAGKIIMQSFKRSLTVKHKNVVELLTKVDTDSERKIISIIKEEYPDHEIFSEETSNKKMSSDDLWIIDPLDGTTNYVHRFPFFCVSIAYSHKNNVVLGVVFDPLRDELFFAEKNKGAFLNDQKIKVSDIEQLSDALLATGFAYERGSIMKKNLEKIEKFLSSGIHGIRRTGSAAIDLCHVACGKADGYWEYHLKQWDHAAGSLIVTEAGGKITKINGEDYEVFKNDIVASNSKIHEQMLKILR